MGPTKFALVFIALPLALASQPTGDFSQGIDRWKIKTSVVHDPSTKPKAVALDKLLKLGLLDKEQSGKVYEAERIPVAMPGGLHEGDIISTTGYLQLVALERDENKRDGDYHMQLRLEKIWGDSCFIVEIPYPGFVTDKKLKALCTKARHDVLDLLDGAEPSESGKVLSPAIKVKVTGQLFYDAIHAKDMRNEDPDKRKYRGKKGNKNNPPMHSYTAWEIHPVFSVEKVK